MSSAAGTQTSSSEECKSRLGRARRRGGGLMEHGMVGRRHENFWREGAATDSISPVNVPGKNLEFVFVADREDAVRLNSLLEKQQVAFRDFGRETRVVDTRS